MSGDGIVRIAISQAAFDAIARTLPLGNVSFENRTDEEGNRLIWLDRAVIDRLRSLRGPGESYSDVILRMAEFFPTFLSPKDGKAQRL